MTGSCIELEGLVEIASGMLVATWAMLALAIAPEHSALKHNHNIQWCALPVAPLGWVVMFIWVSMSGANTPRERVVRALEMID
jgi:hypothetical protein